MKIVFLSLSRSFRSISCVVFFALPLSGCMYNKVQSAISETNAAMLAPLLGTQGAGVAKKNRQEVASKLENLIVLNEGNPKVASRLQVRHAMLYTVSNDSDDEPIARMSWRAVDQSQLSGRDLELARCNDPLVFWFQNSKKEPLEFWVPTEQARIHVLQGHIDTFTASVDRLGGAPSTRTYLAELRVQMAQRMLEKKKSRAAIGEQAEVLIPGEAEKHLSAYLDAYLKRDIDEVRRAVVASKGDPAELDKQIFASAKSARDAYGPYLIVDRVRQFRDKGLIQQMPSTYQWVTSVN